MIIVPYTLAKIKIRDYAKWKHVFDDLSAVRKAYGAKKGFPFQEADSPNEVTVLIEWDNLESAHKYYRSDEMTEKALQGSGTKEIEIYFLNEVEHVQMCV